MASDDVDALLAEQVKYYRARAGEYDDDMWQPARAPDLESEVRELDGALDEFGPTGDVLELGCGTGVWTQRLVSYADRVTALDASPEMLHRARAKLERSRDGRDGKQAEVAFIHADVFDWTPPQRYDVVFFSYVLSHVPPARFDAFWRLVADCLRPGGRVFFIDAASGEVAREDLAEGGDVPVVHRQLRSGDRYRIVKVFYTPNELEAALADRGWAATVRSTAQTFYWGTASIAD